MSVTVRDVARAANVSIATVSKVLNDKEGAIRISEATRQRVLKAAKELNYHPNISARRLVSDKSNTIGLVFDTYTSFGGTINAEILQGIGKSLDRAGVQLALVSRESTSDLEEHLKAMIASKQVDGLIMWTPGVSPSFCAYLDEIQLPHCHVAYYPELDQCPAVSCDNVGGAYQATEHLLRQGHRRIGLIVPQQDPEGKDRLKGYRQALKDWNVPFEPRWVVSGKFTSTTDLSALDVPHLKRALEECSAFFAASDFLAMTAISVMRSCGYVVGRDRAIVGFDGLEIIKHLDPPLSSVRQHGYEMGKLAAESILNQISDRSFDLRSVVKTSLIERESSRRVSESLS